MLWRVLTRIRKARHVGYKNKTGGFLIRYFIEELLSVVYLQEGGVRGQRPSRVYLDRRPPPVVNECYHWGCGVNSGVCFGSSVSVVNGCPRWENSEYPALCTQKLGITCPCTEEAHQALGLLLVLQKGAAQPLGAGALLVNPWNITEVASSIGQALNMRVDERKK
ncbi:hypothetical protein AgCh_004031 [Apium graveolens]